MEMTEKEICRSYDNAEKKRAQIQILAELNACDPGKIREILMNNGFSFGGRPKKSVDALMEEAAVFERKKETEKVSNEAAELPDIVIEAVNERYHSLLRLKERYLDDVSKIDEQIKALEPYIKKGARV